MGVNTDKGWFSVPGIRERADRTLQEQMLGLDAALAEAGGKSVLDLGCAEGLIGREFARAGAKRVLGIEVLQSHLDIALKACRTEIIDGKMQFACANLHEWISKRPEPVQFDIVLALGIVHKLAQPELLLRWAAKSARTLLCFRGPGRKELQGWDGVIKSKHGPGEVNVPKTMESEGFALERTENGVRGEGVHYWRRVR